MSKKKRLQTAEDFMAELASDAEYLRVRAEKDEHYRLLKVQSDQLLEPILDELNSAEVPADSLQNFVAIRPLVRIGR